MEIPMPITAHERESLMEIRDLTSRYAIAVDSRDITTLVELFVPDVSAGRRGRGHEALSDYYNVVLRDFKSTIHFVGTHSAHLDSDDAAHGDTYCIAYHEMTDHWFELALHYDDTYRRVNGVWLFVGRPVHVWFSDRRIDTQVRPNQSVRGTSMPFADSESWRAFWADDAH